MAVTHRRQIIVILRSLGITGIIMILCYRSFWAAILFPVIWFWQAKEDEIKKQEEKNNRLKEEFLHGITVLNASLQAGFSMENAWKEVEKETKNLYGETAELFLELKEINQKTAHNAPIEKLLLDFAYRCKVEEVIQFAELLEFGKRSGSNWKNLISTTVAHLSQRQEAIKEIEVMVAEKRMEQKVMNIVPLGLLAFLQFSAWDYMKVLYHNLFGVIWMTIFLIAYIGAILLSKNILKVEL